MNNAMKTGTPPTTPFILQYDVLRERLRELSAAPVPDRDAIDAVIVQLDQAHAALKAHHCQHAPPAAEPPKNTRPCRHPAIVS